jgi:tetratricopeptide (TPR) repeat protein
MKRGAPEHPIARSFTMRRDAREGTLRLPLPAAALAGIVLAACAQQPSAPPGGDAARAPGGAAPSQREAKPQPPAQAARTPTPLPSHELTEQIMFKMMLAEVALQRGQAQIAVPAYLELARETRDPRVARRAAEVAWNARVMPAALEAAGLWLQADPESQRARQVIAALLVNQAKLDEALPHLRAWLAAEKAGVGQTFMQIASLVSRHKDKRTAWELIRALAEPYPDVPEARLAVAQMAWNAEQADDALAEARAALKLRPDWEIAALFEAQVLQRRSNAEALAFLALYLERHPKAKDVQLHYARLLVSEKNYGEARRQFEALVREYPQNPDVAMAVALLAMQANDHDAAEAQFKRALEANYKDPDAVRLYLGQVNEDRKRFDEALKWYGSVTHGEQYIAAQARYAGVLAKQGRLADARKHLQQVGPKDDQQRVQLILAEGNLLREASAYQEAFDLLGESLEARPENPDLLYDHAMIAEKVRRVDVLESNLRKLIRLRPDHAHAYNALGYTFADRNERLEEAHELIATGLKLAPDDPFIMDSMGWVLYRLGRNDEALGYLRRAHTQRPDAEIAAHLGEVLWVAGQRDEALRIWNQALKQHPANEVLRGTMRRLVKDMQPAAR